MKNFPVLLSLVVFVTGESIPCALRPVEFGNVCVCNATYCDTIERVGHINEDEYVLFISTKEGQRFNKSFGKFNQSERTAHQFRPPWFKTPSIEFTVDTSTLYQKVDGFGGALTDSAGINILSLSKHTQEHLLRSYFSEHGIEYNLCRMPIAGSDFSTRPYSYDDGIPDPQLERFSLAKEDFKYKIPMIQRAMNMSVKEIHIVAASWSPPAWMKSNNQISGFSYLKDEHYDTYAKYLIRFLDEYRKNNIEIWAISTGNEPSNGILPIMHFNSLGWTPLAIANWTVNYFGPQIRKSVHNKTLILAFDDQRLFLPWWIDLMVKADKDVLCYVDGFAVHWYWDFLVGPSVVNRLHDKYPRQFTLYTEASVGDKPWEKKVMIGSWERGELYLANIIQNLNVWVTGWIDWNLALDVTGGPNWVKNHVDSAILVNASVDEFYKQPMFYALGHVSKFVERGASRVRVQAPTDVASVEATAVRNPDGRIVVVLINKNNQNVEVTMNDVKKGRIHLELPARTFGTILYYS